jgi:hypothetical protein
MPDEHGNTKPDDDPAVGTSLHAYKDGREEDIKGDVEALKSNDPKQLKQDQIEGDDELQLAHEKA